MKHSITHVNYTKDDLSLVEEVIQQNYFTLSLYIDQLLWWNKKVNLVSRDVSHETLMAHVAHSLLLSQLPEFKKADQIIDTGSGGGLPGLPLAVCFPEKDIMLNDIVAKKTMVAKQIALKIDAKNVAVKSGSIAGINIEANTLLLSKHAFKVYELVGLIKKSEWKDILFLKGEEEAEVEILQTESSISATIFNLDNVLLDDFYKGKAIVHVTRNDE